MPITCLSPPDRTRSPRRLPRSTARPRAGASAYRAPDQRPSASTPILSRRAFPRADYDFTGDGVVDYTLNPPGGTLTATYPAAGVYTPIVTATDSFGRVVQRRFAVLADANPDAKLRATFNAMLDSLRAGDVDGALSFITGGASAQYATLFNGLKQAGKLTDAVNALGTLRGSTVGPDFGEVILTRDTPSGTVAFPIWFLRGPDGVWRIEGM